MSGHAVSIKLYLKIFAVLIGLTALTAFLAFVPLGRWNALVAVLIAGSKAVLIIMVFMHVRYGPRLILVFSGLAFLWLGILIALTFGDYVSRVWLSFFG